MGHDRIDDPTPGPITRSQALAKVADRSMRLSQHVLREPTRPLLIRQANGLIIVGSVNAGLSRLRRNRERSTPDARRHPESFIRASTSAGCREPRANALLTSGFELPIHRDTYLAVANSGKELLEASDEIVVLLFEHCEPRTVPFG